MQRENRRLAFSTLSIFEGNLKSIVCWWCSTNQEIVMTPTSLSPLTAPQLEFDATKLRTLIAEYVGVEAERVTDEAHFSDDLGLDWLDQIELIMLIEDGFAGIEISETQIEVVGDLIRHIENTNNPKSVVKNHQNTGPAFRRSAA
jgi:acyl carrier protein